MFTLVPDCYKDKPRTVLQSHEGFEVVRYSEYHAVRVFLEKDGYIVACCFGGFDDFVSLHKDVEGWVKSMVTRHRRNLRCLREDLVTTQTNIDRTLEIFGELK